MEQFPLNPDEDVERHLDRDPDVDSALAGLLRQYLELHERVECDCEMCRDLRAAAEDRAAVVQAFGLTSQLDL